MVMMMQPPQSREVPGTLMAIRWHDLVPGDSTGATIASDSRPISTFDGHTTVAGLRRAANEDWIIDLDRLDPAADTVDLWVHAARDGRRRLALTDLNSPDGVEHIGLDVPRGNTYTVFRLTRKAGYWDVTALFGRTDRKSLLDGGETVVFALDRSASMLSWYESGAVARLIAAVQDEARTFQIPALRISFDGGQRAQLLQSSAPATEFIRDQLRELKFATGSDCVASARSALSDTGSEKKVTILVTDSPPVGDVSSLLASSRTVIAVLGMDQDGEMVDAERWLALRNSGAPIVAFGDASQAMEEIVGMLSDAVHSVH